MLSVFIFQFVIYNFILLHIILCSEHIILYYCVLSEIFIRTSKQDVAAIQFVKKYDI